MWQAQGAADSLQSALDESHRGFAQMTTEQQTSHQAELNMREEAVQRIQAEAASRLAAAQSQLERLQAQLEAAQSARPPSSFGHAPVSPTSASSRQSSEHGLELLHHAHAAKLAEQVRCHRETSLTAADALARGRGLVAAPALAFDRI